MSSCEPAFTLVVNKSTLYSLIAFCTSVGMTALLQKRQQNEPADTITSSVSSSSQGDNDDDDDDNGVIDDHDDDEEEQEWYLRRRLQNRLSFRNAAATADDERTAGGSAAQSDVQVDFNPKNSNWHHFECISDPSSSGEAAVRRSRPVLTVRESLYGETVTTGSASGSDEEKRSTDDEDFSLTSADHFVWTEAHYSPKQRTRVVRQLQVSESGIGRLPPHPSEMLQGGSAGTVSSLTGRKEEKTTTETTPLRMPLARRTVSLPIPRPTESSSKTARSRAQYNARIMPNRVVLVRHGQSVGNIDERVYSTTPDNTIPLTKLGWEQAQAAGQRLKYEVLPQNCQIHFIVSPYVRTVETFHGMLSAWCDPKSFAHIPDRHERIKAWYSKIVEMGITWAEDPRIREQDFGNLQDPVRILQAKRDRRSFGAFYYRFANGESAADVFDRISTFLDSLWRSFDMNKSQYFVIVTHGISIRVLLSRYFRYTIDQFHLLSNPRNCEMVVLEHE